MKWLRGESGLGYFLLLALVLAALAVTCVMVTWISYSELGVLAFATNGQPSQPAISGDRPATGASGDRPAPDFTLTDLDGNRVSLSQFSGQPVVVNFWATWCPPCKIEIPHLIEAYEREQGEVVFLAVSVDEPASVVRRFAEENDMPFTILLDDGGSVAEDYGVQGIPTTFFISRDGQIAVRYVGPMSSHAIDEGLRRIRE